MTLYDAFWNSTALDARDRLASLRRVEKLIPFTSGEEQWALSYAIASAKADLQKARGYVAIECAPWFELEAA
jgi:hypothetical protein